MLRPFGLWHPICIPKKRVEKSFVVFAGRFAMRVLAIIGILLIVFGIVALGFQGVTFFTTDRVVDAGPLHVDVQRPHTIILHPIAGIAAVVAGLILVVVGAAKKDPSV
jgi:uncharacterized membrane protein HdeD (DUF308 family)